MLMLLRLTLLLAFILPAHFSAADCGDIVIPAGYSYTDSPEDHTPIEDCSNPFGETTHLDSSVTNFINNSTLTTNTEITLDTLPTTLPYDQELSGIPAGIMVDTMLYHQVGNDFYLVPYELPNVTFSATGTYVFVTNAYELILNQNDSWWSDILDLFRPKVAYAQVSSGFTSETYVTTS